MNLKHYAQSVIESLLEKKDAKSPYFCSKECRATNILGKSFGDLKVIYRDGHTKVTCECKCGNIATYHKSRLKSHSKCKDCLKESSSNSVSKQLFSFIKYYAIKRNLSFTVTREHILDLYKQQSGKCYYSGVDIRFAKNRRDEDHGGRSASLDRVDSTIGYDEGNLKWVHKNINLMKWDIPENEFLRYIKKIVEFDKKFIAMECYNIKHHSCFKGIGEISKSYWNTVKAGASSRKLDFEIKMNDAWELYNKQGGVCYYSGIPIRFDHSYRRRAQTASIDRLDSSKGYVKGNIVICHKDINRMKRQSSEYYFLVLCKQIYDHMNLKECIIPSTHDKETVLE